MKRRVFVRQAASGDLDEAFRWYEDQRHGLGEEFLAEIDVLMGHIAEHLEGCPIVVAPYRRALARRFPYAVYYRVTSAWVQVLAVFHVRRDPRSLRRRLPPP